MLAFTSWSGAQPQAQASAKAVIGACFAAHELLASTLRPALLVIALLLPFIPGVDRRIVDLGILMLTYVMLGWGLNIVVGLAGLLDLGYVAFYAVGAYSYALLSTIYFPIWFGDGSCPGPSGWCCPWPVSSRRCGESSSASRSCACAATISPS